MIKPVSALLVSTLFLTSCGSVRDSQYNPMNWFGASRSQAVQNDETVNPLIPKRRRSESLIKGLTGADEDGPYEGLVVTTITELVVERRPGGAVIRVSGVGGKSGLFDPRLIPVEAESDATTLTFELRARPGMIAPAGGEFARAVTVAIVLTDQDLGNVRTIRVKGTQNERVTRR